ncbi:RNA-guided endonuclease InsQ/TnpB family protein [Thermococcus celericrescens]|uniref:RNA-guided endonuclease InsQ/TnpB family protein n=1 Tax=Thermococcus celericrescens TaxID=227598 RepID=UPI000A4470CD
MVSLSSRANGKPVFKKEVIMLDDHLFKLDLENRIIKLSTPNRRTVLEFYPAKHHEKFRDWRVGQAWLVRTPKGVFINVVFSKEVEIREPEAFVGVDLNENNVTLSLPNGEFVQIITHEREIRAGYFLKRRKIQKKIRAGKRRRELLEKYGERERNRLNDLYHKLTNKIVELAEKYGGIALEDLTEIRDSIRYSAEVNGRLHRWSFRKLQSIIEYKAKLKGIRVVFVNPAYTSSLCPVCGGKLSPNGDRVLKCSNCGFEADRDVIGSWNVRLRALKMWGVSVLPESQPMKTGGWKVSRNDIYELYANYG